MTRLQKCIRMEITIFKFFIWGGILLDICSEFTFYGSARASPFNYISDCTFRMSDNMSPQMKNLNTVISQNISLDIPRTSKTCMKTYENITFTLKIIAYRTYFKLSVPEVIKKSQSSHKSMNVVLVISIKCQQCLSF